MVYAPVVLQCIRYFVCDGKKTLKALILRVCLFSSDKTQMHIYDFLRISVKVGQNPTFVFGGVGQNIHFSAKNEDINIWEKVKSPLKPLFI